MFYLWIAWLDDFCENQEWVKAGMPDDFDWPKDDRHYEYISAGVSLYDSGKKGQWLRGVPKTWRRMYFLYCEAGYGLDYLEHRDRDMGLFTGEWDIDRRDQKMRMLEGIDYLPIEKRILSYYHACRGELPLPINVKSPYTPTGRIRR